MQRFIFARASVPTGSAVEYALAHTGEQGRWGGEKRARLGGRGGLVMRSITNRRWSAHFTFSSEIVRMLRISKVTAETGPGPFLN